MARYDVTVIIPAWNERENLEIMLPALKETLGELNVSPQIIVVDGGSKDGTEEAVRKRGVGYLLQSERGYGGALMAGFAAAESPYIVTMDADLSHRPAFLFEFWRNRDRADVLIASRYVPGGRAEMSRFRRLLSAILNRTFAVVLSAPIRDLSSGFRMYRVEFLREMPLVARDFDVLEEILIRAINGGARVMELPFHYMPRGSGQSHARLIKFGWAYVKTLHRMRRLRREGLAAEAHQPVAR
jgi:dolichol-phosphate mannosyltransferase